MKKFNFRLQRVLDYRNTLKKEKELELAQRNATLFSEEEKFESLERLYDDISPEKEIVTMAELALKGNYQQYLRDALDEQQTLVNEAIVAVDSAREAYIEKAVESKTLEMLKDRQSSQHKEEQKVAIKKDLDKQTVSRHRFNKQGFNQGE